MKVYTMRMNPEDRRRVEEIKEYLGIDNVADAVRIAIKEKADRIMEEKQ